MKTTAFSPAAKVGITTLIGVAVLTFFIIWIGKLTPGQEGTHVTVRFKDVGGLLPGARVQLMGVKVGEVLDMNPQSDSVAVGVYINRPGITVASNATFMITSKGLVGDRVLEIYPPHEPEGIIQDGAVIEGETAATIAELSEKAGRIMNDVTGAIQSSDNQALARRTRDSLDTVVNKELPATFAKIDRLAAQLEQLATSANTVVSGNTKQLHSVITNARAVTDEARAITAALAPLVTTPQGKVRLGNTVDHMHNLAAKVDAIASDVQQLTGDKALTSDVRELVTNAKEAAQNAKVLTKTLLLRPTNLDEKGFKVNFRTELLGSLRQEQFFSLNSRLHGNFNVFGNMGFGPIPYYRLGLDDIGESNLVNLQLGMPMPDGVVARFGLIRNKLGIGSDVPFWDGQTLFSGELYDIVTPRMRLGLLQNLSIAGLPPVFQDTGVSVYWDNQFRTGIQEFNFGVRWQPHN
jgi:phospholipid/cholesterol/gamma-HCH transport system substrate-binding protein